MKPLVQSITLLMALLMVACQSADTTPEPVVPDNSLITGNPCAPPCWQGLTPDVSTYDEVIDFLESSPMANETIQEREGYGWRYISWWWAEEEYNSPNANRFEFGDDNTVQEIVIRPNTDITIREIVEVYGLPDSIYAEAQRQLLDSPASQYPPDDIYLSMLYVDQAFRVELREAISIEAGSSTFPFCLSLDSGIDKVFFYLPYRAKIIERQYSENIQHHTIFNAPYTYSIIQIADGEIQVNCVELVVY